jgi:gluconate 2-dehydrogenase gamma chain
MAASDGSLASHDTYLFFNPAEARFIELAVDRLIPPDDSGPSATEAGVPVYIDRQLGGAWGAGERLYRAGPWQRGAPTQGYQLPYTPAELFRTALRGSREQLEKTRQPAFDAMTGPQQDAYLTLLQTTELDLSGVPSKVFFESLLGMTIEGYFCDPVYGGNRGMAAWRMIGFPGAYGAYYDLVDQHGVAFTGPPRSLAERAGHVHVMPGIPATAPAPQGRPMQMPASRRNPKA